MTAEHREREPDGCPGGRHQRDALCQLTDPNTLTPDQPEETP